MINARRNKDLASKRIFVTGIGTDVGKTMVSAVLVQSLDADYWKPVQSGTADGTDAAFIEATTETANTVIYPPAYSLKEPLSPHAAAALENKTIDLKTIIEPQSKRNLIIEGAGGLFVPLNTKDFIFDLIQPHHKIVLVSRHYLGSINHTLLSLHFLKRYGGQLGGIIFSGDENLATEEAIINTTKVPFLGRINEEAKFDKDSVMHYAEKLKPILLNL